jgi:D-alanyl-lipoteichoic acid acyltransferase DltB (MBOAT superfamily)
MTLSLATIGIITLLALPYQFLSGRLRGWALMLGSVVAIYLMQPALPIRFSDFLLPTATLTLTAVLWWRSRAPDQPTTSEDALALTLMIATVLGLSLFRFVDAEYRLTPSRPPEPLALLLGLGVVLLIVLSISTIAHFGSFVRRWLQDLQLPPKAPLQQPDPPNPSPITVQGLRGKGVATEGSPFREGEAAVRGSVSGLLQFNLSLLILLIILVFLALKTESLATALSGVWRGLTGQDVTLASALDLNWLGFSYVAFRLIHTLRDRLTGLLPALTLREYVTYVLFFPAYTAGPIDRAERFVEDLRATSYQFPASSQSQQPPEAASSDISRQPSEPSPDTLRLPLSSDPTPASSNLPTTPGSRRRGGWGVRFWLYFHLPQVSTGSALSPSSSPHHSITSSSVWLSSAFSRIALGLFQKFVLADSLASGLALNPVNAEQITSAGWAWVLLYSYALRLFLDFSGYTDIAIGLGLLFGIRLPENFNRPYLKPDITAFWQSWHMTLSNWARFYVFTPLSRWLLRKDWASTVVTVLLAQVVTMTVIGLWHGVTLNFFIWGLWQALGLGLHKQWSDRTRKWYRGLKEHPGRKRAWTLFAWFITFHYIVLGWVWFALPGFDQAVAFFRTLAGR